MTPGRVSILIVDDSEDERYLLQRDLEELGLELCVLEACDGKAALDLFIEHEESRRLYPGVFPPLIIFLDINMPRMNGHEFLVAFSRLRDTMDCATSSLVMMFTSSEREQDRQKSLAYDFVIGYLEKGKLDAAALRPVVERLMGERSS